MVSWSDFVELAQKEFSFLSLNYGFNEASREAPFLDYERGKLRVSLYFKSSDRSELDLLIRRNFNPSAEWIPAKRLSDFGNSAVISALSHPGEEFCPTLKDVESRLRVMAHELSKLCESSELLKDLN